MHITIVEQHFHGKHHHHNKEIRFTVGPVSEQSVPFTEREVPMYVLTDSQQTAMAITVVDKKGNPAPIDGTPKWSSSDESLLAVTPSEDGLSAVAVAVGPLGQAQVNVTVDADLGDGVLPLAGVLDVQIVGGQAVALAISAGIAEEQPEQTV